MAVVHPEERAASAGILSVSRNTVRQSRRYLQHLFGQSAIRAAVSIGWWVEDCL